MTIIPTILFLATVVNAGLFKVLMKEGCDFDRDSASYVCVKIKDTFPKMYYGDYNLRCLYCDINVFSKDTFPYKNTLLVFNVSESKITTITAKAFENLKYLQHIHLENNEIVNITEDAFYGLRHIYELHLENNKIGQLVPGFLNGFEANAVILKHNHLIEIPDDVFRGLHTIMILDLSHNSIISLEPDSLKHLSGLEILELQHNELCNLQVGIFKYLKNLRELNLAVNKLTAFPLGLFSPLKDLHRLNVSYNQLKDFDSNILLPLRVLNVLDISVNGLRSAESIGTIKEYVPTLTWLALHDNFWDCVTLNNILRYLKNSNVQVLDHSLTRYDIININGIACVDSLLSLSEDVTLAQFLDTVKSTTLNFKYC